MKPSRHEKWEGWRELDESRHVILSLDNSTEEIGAGLRLDWAVAQQKSFRSIHQRACLYWKTSSLIK
ncbi:contact-dependent growth inhibition system immunity protein [Providencia stuartii]|nr:MULTISPECIES: contact-dependent growth inhibition system immunity protein [Providencia]MDK7735315.1 contact-dependent growth inhibition system immunity protein [Providencia stuartii]MDN0010210.1 contact-dependent growth inhibition system immunity protein [Providencia stuartii]MDN0018644.1 contact-dependent growth inhibition system immunity protein [Providencia stuartii]MDT1066910.1 contact-dependent growth inhibition system immunity protein [Providencia stuartii]